MDAGILPTEYKCLILPAPVEEKTKGGLILAEETKDKEKYATTEGTLIAVSPLAFSYATPEEWAAAKAEKPKPGDRVVFVKYAGLRRKGKDGKDYILCNDKDIVAIIEDHA